MARILLKGEWYEALLPDAIYESEYEDLIIEQSQWLFPQYHTIPFKKTLESEFGNGRPDVALIAQDFSHWWLIEVELGTHAFRQHVFQQVAVFSSAVVHPDLAPYIASKLKNAPRAQLLEMLLGAPPRVMVLVNQVKPDWAIELKRWNAIVCVVELFRNRHSEFLLRVNGDHPSTSWVAPETVTRCKVDLILRRSLVIESPARLPIRDGEIIDLWYQGGLTQWQRVDSRTTVWLMPTRRCPFASTSGGFEILEVGDSHLHLKEVRWWLKKQ